MSEILMVNKRATYQKWRERGGNIYLCVKIKLSYVAFPIILSPLLNMQFFSFDIAFDKRGF